MEAKDLMINNYVYFNCFDSSKIIVKITGYNDGIVLGVSEERTHWCNIEKVEPVPLTPEILEKNEFKKDAFTNLSPDFYFGDDDCSICVNLQSTCDKSKGFFVENRKTKRSIDFNESRHCLQKESIYVHELQHALRLCGIEKEIVI